jgi:DNA-directed RNA polymerase subunit RPC12/RpoP
MKKKLRCPNCRHEQLARIARHGFLRKKVFSIFGFYPWECAICRRQFMLWKRGAAYRKVSRPSSEAEGTTSTLRSQTY